MKISRTGIVVLISLVAVFASSCSFYYRVVSRKSLVDGAKAYNERKYPEAEELFKKAVSYDEEMTTFEGRTAQLFLARTVHADFASKRKEKAKAEVAIVEYKKAMKGYSAFLGTAREAAKASPDDQAAQAQLAGAEKDIGSIISAVASLFTNLEQDDKWKQWQESQAKDTNVPSKARANAYISLAAKQYTCANDISDDDAVKKTVKEDDKDVFKFSKPESEEDFEKLQECTKNGSEYIDQALKLNDSSDSAWSYKTSLLVQKSRIAEMEGDNEARDKFKTESDEAKAKYTALAKKRREAEEAKAKKEAEEKAKEIGGKTSEGKEAEEK